MQFIQIKSIGATTPRTSKTGSTYMAATVSYVGEDSPIIQQFLTFTPEIWAIDSIGIKFTEKGSEYPTFGLPVTPEELSAASKAFAEAHEEYDECLKAFLDL